MAINTWFSMGVIKKILRFFLREKTHNQDSEKILTLFNTKEYNRPGYTNYKKCPHCGAEGNTNEEIRELLKKFDGEAKKNMKQMNFYSETLYKSFKEKIIKT